MPSLYKYQLLPLGIRVVFSLGTFSVCHQRPPNESFLKKRGFSSSWFGKLGSQSGKAVIVPEHVEAERGVSSS